MFDVIFSLLRLFVEKSSLPSATSLRLATKSAFKVKSVSISTTRFCAKTVPVVNKR
ncbi:hypothetical protein D3C80_2114020 [compost metagenome]